MYGVNDSLRTQTNSPEFLYVWRELESVAGAAVVVENACKAAKWRDTCNIERTCERLQWQNQISSHPRTVETAPVVLRVDEPKDDDSTIAIVSSAGCDVVLREDYQRADFFFGWTSSRAPAGADRTPVYSSIHVSRVLPLRVTSRESWFLCIGWTCPLRFPLDGIFLWSPSTRRTWTKPDR